MCKLFVYGYLKWIFIKYYSILQKTWSGPLLQLKMKVDDEKGYAIFLEDSKKYFLKNIGNKGEKYQADLNDFEIFHKLGSGAFGKVVLIRRKNTDDYYAMKILKKQHLIKTKQVEHTLNEKRILQFCRHPFLMTMMYFAQDNSHLYFVLPFMHGADLYATFCRSRHFNETTTKFYAGQVLLGIEYLHYLEIIYRDLKPENIMIDINGYIKLTDFGFCKMLKGRTYTICGTPEYIAPELVTMKGYGFSADWWSFGILLFELTAGYVPFKDTGDHVKLYNTILSGKYRMHGGFSKDLKDLIFNLLQVDTTRRLGCLKQGVKEIKDHKWFADLPWIHLLNKKIIPPLKPNMESPVDAINSRGEEKEKLSEISSINRYEDEFKDY